MRKPKFLEKLTTVVFKENQNRNRVSEYRVQYKREIIHRSQKIYFLQPLICEAGKINPYQKYSIIEIYDNDFVVVLKENDRDAKACVIPQCFIEKYAIDANTYCNFRIMKVDEHGEKEWWRFWNSVKQYKSSDYACTTILEEYKESLNIISALIISLFQHCDNEVASSYINDIIGNVDKLIEVYCSNQGDNTFSDMYGAELSTYNYIKRIINNYVRQYGYKDFGSRSAKEVAFKIVNGMED